MNEKQITKAEEKRLIQYLKKAHDYILELESKYDVETILISNQAANDGIDYLVSVEYVINNSKE